jgi:hypothetical protein
MTSTQKQKTVSGGSVAGSLSELIAGWTAFDAFWSAGRRKPKIMLPFSISPAVSSPSEFRGYSDKLLLQTTSVLLMKNELPSCSSTCSKLIGLSELGHPDLDSNSVSEENSGCPHATHSYTPSAWLLYNAPLNALSVPFWRTTRKAFRPTQ